VQLQVLSGGEGFIAFAAQIGFFASVLPHVNFLVLESFEAFRAVFKGARETVGMLQLKRIDGGQLIYKTSTLLQKNSYKMLFVFSNDGEGLAAIRTLDRICNIRRSASASLEQLHNGTVALPTGQATT
jgi:hypothetical protein